MTPAIPAASASAAPRRAGKGAAPATPAWSAQPPSRTAAHANTAFAGAPRIPRPPSPQAARAPALFAPSPPLAHAAQTVPQPQAIPTQTHPIHRSSIKVGNDARTLKGVGLRPPEPVEMLQAERPYIVAAEHDRIVRHVTIFKHEGVAA